MNIAKKVLAAYTFLVVFGLSLTGVFIYSQKDGNQLETSAAVTTGTICCNRKSANSDEAGTDCRVVNLTAPGHKVLASWKLDGTSMPIGQSYPDYPDFCFEIDNARPISLGAASCVSNDYFPVSDYGACSATCGGGTQVRLEQNACGIQRSSEPRPCNTHACPPSNTAPTITQWRMNSAGHSDFDIFNRQAYYVTVGAERIPVLGGNSNVSAQFSDVNNNLVNATRRLDYVSALITDPAPVTTQNASGIAQARYDLPLGTAASTGDAVVRFTATDAANAVTNATQNVIVDNILPTATFVTAPAEGSTVSGNIEVTADFQDNIGLFRYMIGIHTINWYCNAGPANHDDQNTPTNGSKNCNIDTTTLADGNYQIVISAIDKAGNISAFTSKNITVQNTVVTPDTDLPTSVLRYVGLNTAGYGTGVSNTGSFTNEANAKFEVTATDATSAISRIDYRCTSDGVFDTSSTIENWTLVPNSSGASPLVVNFEVAGLADDTYTCETRATDASSNVEAAPFSNDVVVNLDRVLPTITFTNNTPSANAMLSGDFTIEVNVDGTFTDDSRLHSVYFGVFRRGSTTVGQWCHAEVVNEASGVKSCNIDVSAFLLNDGSSLTEGDYDIWVSVQDKAVNQANLIRSISIDFTVSSVTYEWGFDVPQANYVANSGTGLTRHVTCNGYINNTNPYRGLWAVPTDVSGIVSYERDVVYNGSFVGSFTNTTNYTDTFTPQTGTTANGGQGVYYVRVRAIDGAGNKSISDLQWSVKTPDSSWCRMTIDIVAPVTVLNAYTPNPTGSGAITFTGNVSDNLTNIANVEYRYSSDAGSTWSAWANVTPNDTFDSTTEGFSFTTPVLTVGNYIFQIRGTDVAGNIETVVNDASQQTLVIVENTIAPIITVDVLGTRDRRPPLTGTVNDPDSTISVTVNGNTYSATNNGDGTWTLVDNAITPALADGIYEVVASATNTDGNTGTDTTTNELSIDRTIPNYTYNGPADSSAHNGQISITGTMIDPLVNSFASGGRDVIIRFRRASDNTNVRSCTANYDSSTGNYSVAVNPGCNVPDGQYNIQIVVRDNFGNSTNAIVSNNVTIDRVLPVINFNGFRDLTDGNYNTTNPIKACGAINSTGFIAWEWNLSNTESGPITYTYTITAGPTAVGYTTTTTNTYYHGGIPAQGKYTVEVYGTDAAGNVGTPVQCSVTYDSTAPVTVLNSFTPNPTNDNTPTFTGTVTDNLTNIANVEYRYSSDGGSTWSTWTNVTPNDTFDSISEGFSLTTPVLADGSYIFQTRGTDIAGNIETIVNDESQQTLVISTGSVVPTEPVVEIDEAFTRMINGYMCGIGSAVADDGLRINITNWTSGSQIQGRYYMNGSSFSSWFNLTVWGTLDISGSNATLTIMNTGNSSPGNAGWEIRVVDSSGNQLGNIDSLNYIITTDLDALACNGQVGLGFQTAENSPQTGVGQCNVTTADLSQNNGNSSLQILRWEAVDFATSYVLNGYSWNGSSWVTSYSNYTVTNSALDFTNEPGYVIYRAWATNEGRYAYEVSAVDSTGNVVGLSTAITSGSVCTFTVDRTPVVPPAPNQGYVGGTVPFSVQRVSTTGVKVSKVNITDLLKNLRARMLTK